MQLRLQASLLINQPAPLLFSACQTSIQQGTTPLQRATQGGCAALLVLQRNDLVCCMEGWMVKSFRGCVAPGRPAVRCHITYSIWAVHAHDRTVNKHPCDCFRIAQPATSQ